VRLVLAHNWVSNPTFDAVFQSLLGVSFTVFDAPPPHDSALTFAGAQYYPSPRISFPRQVRRRVYLRLADLRRHAAPHVAKDLVAVQKRRERHKADMPLPQPIGRP
jgi:hypothetical protein